MKLALGKMQIPPATFWDMSLEEFLIACEGFTEFHSNGEPPPLTRNELDSLMERYPD